MDDIDMSAAVVEADGSAAKDSPKKKKRSCVRVEEGEAPGGTRNISAIRSKIRRNNEWVRLRKEKRKEKRKRQDERRKVTVPVRYRYLLRGIIPFLRSTIPVS